MATQPNPWEIDWSQQGAAPVAAPAATPPLATRPGRPNAPPGYRPSGGGLAPIPGGPADPARSAPSGYRFRSDGGLEAIPGGPADPDRNNRGPSGNQNLNGAAYLATIPDAARRAQAQALAEGRIPWPSGRAATDPHWQQTIADAIQYDPSLDAATSASRRQAILQFTGNGAAAQRIASANRLAHHLEDLHNASERLVGPDTGFSPANAALAAGGQLFEPTDARTYDTAVNSVANELERFFRQAGGSEADIHRMIGNLSRWGSRETRNAAIQEVMSLIHGGVGPLQDQYNSAFQQGTARPAITWVDPEAQRIYRDIGGIDFSMPAQGGQPRDGGEDRHPPTAGGPHGGAPTAPMGAPPASDPNRPAAGAAGPAIQGASSDTPPTQALSQRYIGLAREAQALFNGGASRQQMDEWARRRGMQPYGPDLDAAIRYRNRGGRGARILPPETETPAGGLARQLDEATGREGMTDLLVQGATLGHSDEVTGAAHALSNILESPFTGNFDPVGSYQLGRDADRIRLNEARDTAGWMGTGAEFVGALASGNPANAVEAAAPTLGGRLIAGSRAGAPVGALAGFGYGSGPGGSVRGAFVGGAGGALVGAAFPAAGAGIDALRDVGRTVAGRNPSLPQRTIANALAADANTPRAVGQQMAEAHANGVPYMIADSGDNARGLLAASARAPGTGRTIARDALEGRQMGLGERVASAVERDLGSASNPHQVTEALMDQARTAAAPLYEQAYARQGADRFANSVKDLMQRPSMRAAMARAARIAQEEGRDPLELGFVQDADGNYVLASPRDTAILDQHGRAIPAAPEPVMQRTPSWQTMDYVKRGLDDVLQAQPRNPATGRLILNEDTRAIQGTLRAFLARFDRLNPDYAAARAAWAGPVRAREAMEIGRRALNMTADDLSARTQGLSNNEMDFVRLGVRRAIVEAVAGKGDTANVVNAVIGTPKRRAMLSRLFGGQENFDRFVSTLQREREGYRTFQRATQGSPTAQNVQDDANLAGTVGTAMTDMATTGLPIGTMVKYAIQLGTSRAGRQAQQEIATMLSETDPARLMELARELRKQAYSARARGRAAGRRAVAAGFVAGDAAGRATGER